MKVDLPSNPILTPKSVRRRRRLSLIAFLLGLGSAVLSLAVVAVSLLQNRNVAEQEYLRTTGNEVRMLAAAIDEGKKENDEQLLNAVFDRWIQAGHWNRNPDEHFVIVNNVDSEVILDTAYRGPSHRPPPSAGLNQVILAVREQMGPQLLPLHLLYSDAFQSESGEPVIGSFIDSARPNWPLGRNWLLGIYRSQAGLHAAVTQFSLFGTLILMCGLAMPVSLLLMYYTYHLAQRDQVLAEQASAQAGGHCPGFGGRHFQRDVRGSDHQLESRGRAALWLLGVGGDRPDQRGDHSLSATLGRTTDH